MIMSDYARPKTSSSFFRRSNSALRCIYGSRCHITLLGQDEHLQFTKLRPSSSVSIQRSRSFCNSSSTPTVPYSTADILYGSEVNGRNQSDDTRSNGTGEGEKTGGIIRQRSKELELHLNNRRPSSKSASRKSLSIDSAVAFDREKEDTMKSASSTLPPTKSSNHFRPNGIRSNLLKGDPLLSSKPNGAAPPSSGRDQDDLVAMGTLWNPNTAQQNSSTPVLPSTQQQQQQQSAASGGSSRSNSISNNTNSNSYPSKVVQSTSSLQSSMSSSNNTMTPQRKYASNNVRPIMVQNNNVSGKKINLKEQEEPKYTDPMLGAPASFQQRIIELGALEGDTVRWERTKKLKKKKQDRDS